MTDETENAKTFTLGEARSLLPRLKKLLQRLGPYRERLLSMRVEIDKAREKAECGGGGSPDGVSYLRNLMAFSHAVREVETLGVLIKDIRTGLVDFPYEMDGRIVYLCWKSDEDEIEWWHEPELGFAGRHPLTEDFK